MNLDTWKNPADPHAAYIIEAPEPCPHGNGTLCDCQLPWYEGLYVAPLTFGHDGKVRHVVARMRMARDGGMREFIDPVSGETVGSCGLFFAWERVYRYEKFPPALSTPPAGSLETPDH